ncbi:MAG: hypothetical protein JXL97_00800 [Bacteroidales bacterium]|nr:hypothetical protein [Bacteroidales bacterium]
MKNLKITFVLLLTLFLFSFNSFSQGISVNTNGADADASAMFDIQSTTGGLLIPRMTSAQKDVISSPATGLMVFQTDDVPGFYFYNGAEWTKLSDETQKYITIASAEAASGVDNDLCYVIENETFYRYEADAGAYSDNDKFVLSTADGGNTRWLGIAGKYNRNDLELMDINHLDATSGTATITDFNQVYYIAGASTSTVITIPDANDQNEGCFLRLYKESGNGPIVIQSATGQNIDGATTSIIYNVGQGFYIKSDNSVEWLKIQDSRSQIPKVINTSADYDGDVQTFQFNFLTADTDASDITITLPSNISMTPEGNIRMFFNTGENRLFLDANGNTLDGSTETRVISPGGYLELEKIGGEIRIIREKNVTVKKLPTDITNLECWLDASQLSGSDGSYVTTWTDLENSIVFTGGSGAQPVLLTDFQNGKNVVHFDGSNDVMSAGDIELHNNSRGLTMVAVVRPNSTNRMAIISKYLTTGDNREFAFGNQDNFIFEELTWASASGCITSLGQNDFLIVEVVWEPGKAFEYYINGSLQAISNLPVNDISDGIANLKIGGGDYTSVGFWDGDFAEIMMYSDAVSDIERKALRENLAVKWDIDEIVISSGGDKFWQRDGNTNTISPDVDNDNIDMGDGAVSGGTFNVSQLLNAPALSTPPLSPQAGSIYFDTNDSKLKVYTGSSWENLN